MLAEFLPLLANPSSRHASGRKIRGLVENVRDQLAAYLRCRPRELFFSSGGTESNQLALRCLAENLGRPATIVSSGLEHPCVRGALERLASEGHRILYVRVKPSSELDLDSLRELLPQADLASFMLVNNETGTIYPLEEIGELCREHEVLLHSDCVQALGRVPIPLKSLHAATFSHHKVGGLTGSGSLYLRDGLNLQGLYKGGNQEQQFRPGTENILGILSLQSFLMNPQRMQEGLIRECRDHLEKRLEELGVEHWIQGQETSRIGSISNIRFSGQDGQTLAFQLDLKGFEVSTGAACSSGSIMPSPVLLAMGMSEEEAKSALRVSFHCYNQPEDAESLALALAGLVRKKD